MTRAGAATAVAAALLAGGCEEAEAELAAGAVHSFVAALADADGATACEHLSEAGVSELLLTAVRGQASPAGLEAAQADRCAIVASAVAEEASGLAALARSPVTSTVLEGDTAEVKTEAGSYEAEEVRGRWRVSRFEPVARVLAGGSPHVHPVELSVVRPKLEEPALGPSLAGRVNAPSVEVEGRLHPEDAQLDVETASGTRVGDVATGGGRFRLRLELREGRNEVLLKARAPERDPSELELVITRTG